MENKEQALLYVKSLAEQKILTREELIASYDSASGIVEKDSKKIGIAEILYYIGGGIVFLGIVILVFQNWDTFGFATKLLATLGAGIAAYVTGVLFAHDPRTENVGSAFYLISALVMPVGLFVVLDHAGIDTGIHYPVALPLLTAYSHLKHKAEDFSNAGTNAAKLISLPMFGDITEDQAQYVAETLRKALS